MRWIFQGIIHSLWHLQRHSISQPVLYWHEWNLDAHWYFLGMVKMQVFELLIPQKSSTAPFLCIVRYQLNYIGHTFYKFIYWSESFKYGEPFYSLFQMNTSVLKVSPETPFKLLIYNWAPETVIKLILDAAAQIQTRAFCTWIKEK